MLRSLTFLLPTLALAASPPAQQPAPLQIQVLNVDKNNGKVVVEIYQTKADWLKKPFRRVTLAPDGNIQKALFDVPHGKYAVSIYQDTDANGELNMNFLSIPKEPIGFGNNYKPLGSPKFESALVEHGAGAKPGAIRLYRAL